MLIQGFVEGAFVMTSWGACEVRDLARLTVRRDTARAAFDAQLAALLASHAAELEAFDLAAADAVGVAFLAGEETAAVTAQQAVERAELVDVHATEIANAQSDAAANIAARLPEIQIGANTFVACNGVTLVGTTASAVDVLISDATIRVVPGMVFAGDGGDVFAFAAEGETVSRLQGGAVADYVVPSVVSVDLDPPVNVYAVDCDGSTCCVCSDTSAAILAR